MESCGNGDTARDPAREPGRDPGLDPGRELGLEPLRDGALDDFALYDGSVVIWYDELGRRSIVTSTAADFSVLRL